MTTHIAMLERARSLSSATLHEAGGQIGALPSTIRPVSPASRICGLAVTVECPPGDNLWIHRALYVELPASPVLVVDVGDGQEAGYWGEILSRAAIVRGITGLVINGGVRDSAALAELDLAVFAQRICIRGTTKTPSHGGVSTVITIGDVEVRPGDLVVGDTDGVVVIPADQAEQAVAAAEEREVKESGILERIQAGETTLDIYGFVP